MNNSDLKNSQSMNNSQTLNNSQSMDYVNLKVAMRPVKFFKLISTEKSRIHDYNYFIEKIQSSGKHNSNQHIQHIQHIQNIQNIQSSQRIIIFLRSNSQEEIKISNEDDWKNYFDYSNRSILELIDSKNTLKIEYSLVKTEQPKKSEKLNFFVDNEAIGHSVLQTVFIQIIQNETLKNEIKEELKNSSLMKSSELENVNKNFDEMLARLLETSLEKIKNLSKLKSDLDRELSECSEDTNCLNVPSFCEYYKNDHLEVFRSKMLSETFSNNK